MNVVPVSSLLVKGIGDVVLVILQRFPDGLLHPDKGGKVNDGVGTIFIYCSVQKFSVR